VEPLHLNHAEYAQHHYLKAKIGLLQELKGMITYVINVAKVLKKQLQLPQNVQNVVQRWLKDIQQSIQDTFGVAQNFHLAKVRKIISYVLILPNTIPSLS